MLKVIVDRERWLRGQGSEFSALLVPHGRANQTGVFGGMMCCMGFACLQAGLDRAAILGHNVVEEARNAALGERGDDLMPGESEKVAYSWDTLLLDGLYVVNDEEGMPDGAREAELIRLGKTVDIEFEFTN
jgi:hypothetical protein